MTVGSKALERGTKPSATADGRNAQATVVRNTVFLLVAQVLGMPLTLASNAVMARKLGPDDFGYIYLATTLVGFGFLVVEWGQASGLPAMIARDRSLAGPLLGAGVAWRLASSVLSYGALSLISAILRYGNTFQGVLVLVTVARVFGMVCAACLDTARGLENTALTAYSSIRYNFVSAGLVVPTLLLGGRLYGVLLALLAADVINTAFVWRGMRQFDVRRLSFDSKTLRSLLETGTPFMFLSLAVTLQPIIDAVLLSKLDTPESVGWYAAARKLIGVLLFPCVAIQGALYPTLCRLFAEDPAGYRKMAGAALRTSTILVVPVALGTGLYPKLGIWIFSEASFGPAEDDLRVLSAFVFLVYFTMTLGSALSAAGRQRGWMIAQFACVAVSAIADPLLIPWFHHRSGNGGLGLCVSTVLSELLMVVWAFLIAPAGLLDRKLLSTLARAFLAGGAMVAVSRQMSSANPLLAAAVSSLAYVACLWVIGGIDRDAIQRMLASRARKAGPGAGASMSSRGENRQL